MLELKIEIIQKEVGDKEASLDNISEAMLSRKNPFWPALQRLFIATEKFTVSKKITIDTKEFYALFYDHETKTIQPAIASLRFFHYIAAIFEETVEDMNKEVIFITKHGKEIRPMVPEPDERQKYQMPIFIGISIEMYS